MMRLLHLHSQCLDTILLLKGHMSIRRMLDWTRPLKSSLGLQLPLKYQLDLFQTLDIDDVASL